MIERDTERQRERHTERHKERQRDREKDKQRDRERDLERHRERQRGRETERETERDLFKIIISLPTNNERLEFSEKTLTGGFSCVNTRLSFDTEILLPNVKNPGKDNGKVYSYKVSYNLKLDRE